MCLRNSHVPNYSIACSGPRPSAHRGPAQQKAAGCLSGGSRLSSVMFMVPPAVVIVAPGIRAMPPPFVIRAMPRVRSRVVCGHIYRGVLHEGDGRCIHGSAVWVYISGVVGAVQGLAKPA